MRRAGGRPGSGLVRAVVLVALLGGCTAAGEEPPPGEQAAVEAGEPGARPDTSALLPVDRGDPPAELQRADVVEGDGEEVAAGDVVEVHYVGVAWSTGEEFDSSWDRGQPFSFPLGAGAVIQGWDQGVEGMRVGGRRVLTIPPELAYGDRGAGDAIGPGETLVFVVDVLGVGQ